MILLLLIINCIEDWFSRVLVVVFVRVVRVLDC